MLSSWQISQLHQQQGAAFASQQAYSQQISAQMPAPYGGYRGRGLGALGSEGGMVGGGSFSYAGGMGGYGPSNSFANTVSSAAFGFGGSMGGMMGIGGAYAGYRMGGFSGAMLGGGLGMMAGSGASHVFGAMASGAQEQAAMERTLSQFQFQNAASRTGTGFSRMEARGIGDMVRQMERVPEMLTSFGELNRIMDKMGQMGLMQGVRDAGEFQNRFRETIKTLKSMSRIIGGTMEEALQTMRESRSAGFYSSGAQIQNLIGMQATSSLTGMSMGQVGALQQYGASVNKAYGGFRASGATAALRTAGQLGLLNQRGILSNDEIMEFTGKEGAAGIQDLAANMTDLSHRMSRGSIGKAMTLALMETDSEGNLTGKMDQGLVDRVRRGEIGLGELKSMARRKATGGGRNRKMQFVSMNRNGRLTAEMASAVGAEGIGLQVQEILGSRGWHNPNATAIVQERLGASYEQVEMLRKMMPNLETAGRDLAAAGREEGRQRALQSAIRENYSTDAIKHKIMTKVRHYTTDWAKDIGVGVRDYVANWAESFVDDVTGRYTETITKGFANSLRQAAAGDARGAHHLQQAFSRAGSLGSAGANNLSVGQSGGLSGLAARGMHWLSGTRTQGERAADFLQNMGGGQFLEGSPLVMKGGRVDFAATSRNMNRSDRVVLADPLMGDAVATDASKVARARRHAAMLQTGSGGMAAYAEFEKSLGAERMAELSKQYEDVMVSGKVGFEADQSKRLEKITSGMGGWTLGSELKAFGPKGRGSVDLIAALNAKAASQGKVYSDRVNVESAASSYLDLPVMGEQATAKRIASLRKSLSKTLRGGDKSIGMIEINKMIDEGDDIGMALLLGSGKHGGMLSGSNPFDDALERGRRTQGATADQASGQQLRDIMARVGSWSQADRQYVGALVAGPGESPEAASSRVEAWVESKKAKDPAFLDKLRNTRGFFGAERELRELYGRSDQLSIMGTIKDIRGRGKSLADRLASKGFEGTRDALRREKGGEALLNRLTMRATGMSNLSDTPSASQLQGQFDDSVSIASSLLGMKHGEQYIGLTDDLTQDAFMGMRRAKRGLRRMGGRSEGKGATLDQVAQTLGIDKSDTAGYETLSGLLGKDQRLQNSELDSVVKAAGGLGLRPKQGSDAKSAYVSEAEIAASLQSFVGETTKLAQVVGNISVGKAPLDGVESAKTTTTTTASPKK